MPERIAYRKVAADTYQALLGTHHHLTRVFPDAKLRALNVGSATSSYNFPNPNP
jgi:hypothetical protein